MYNQSQQNQNFSKLIQSNIVIIILIFSWYLYIKMHIRKKQQKDNSLRPRDILNKLQKSGVKKESQYQEIIANLTQQNQRLFSDLNQLKEKVIILIDKQKQQRQMRKKQPVSQENIYMRTKAQLEKKYQEFEALKKKIARYFGQEPVSIHFQSYVNECNRLQAEITLVKKQLKDVKKDKRHLNKSVKSSVHISRVNSSNFEMLEFENRQLKKKIWSLRKFVDVQEHEEVKLQNSIVSNQKKFRKNNQRVATTLNQVRQLKIGDKMELLKESNYISSHRFKTELYEESPFQQHKTSQFLLPNSQMSTIQNRQIIPISITINPEKQKELLSNKNKLMLRTLKSLQNTKINCLKKLQQLSEGTYKNIQENKTVQTDQQFHEVDQVKEKYMFQLRRDEYGSEGSVQLNDRELHLHNINTCITGLIIYQSEKGFGSIRAIYSNDKISPLLIPDKLIQRFKQRKIIMNTGDWITGMAIKYNKKQKRIIGILTTSNEGSFYQLGEKGQAFMYQGKNQEKYIFDTIEDQCPVSIYASHRVTGNSWFLTKLGIQINQEQS